MIRRILIALGLAFVAAGAGDAHANAILKIYDGRTPQPVRLAAADQVGRMVFAAEYRPTLEDAIPQRVRLRGKGDVLKMEDWLRDWGSIQIHQVGRPY